MPQVFFCLFIDRQVSCLTFHYAASKIGYQIQVNSYLMMGRSSSATDVARERCRRLQAS